MQVIRNKAGAIIAIDHTDEIMEFLGFKKKEPDASPAD